MNNLSRSQRMKGHPSFHKNQTKNAHQNRVGRYFHYGLQCIRVSAMRMHLTLLNAHRELTWVMQNVNACARTELLLQLLVLVQCVVSLCFANGKLKWNSRASQCVLLRLPLLLLLLSLLFDAFFIYHRGWRASVKPNCHTATHTPWMHI